MLQLRVCRPPIYLQIRLRKWNQPLSSHCYLCRWEYLWWFDRFLSNPLVLSLVVAPTMPIYPQKMCTGQVAIVAMRRRMQAIGALADLKPLFGFGRGAFL